MAGKKSFHVTAPMVLLDAADAVSRERELYRGSPVPEGVSEEWLNRHLSEKLIGSQDDLITQPAEGATPAAEPKKAPAKSS